MTIYGEILEKEKKYQLMESDMRKFKSGLQEMRRDGAAARAREVFGMVPSFAGHLSGGKTKASLYTNFYNISEALSSISKLDPGYQKELASKEPYGLDLGDDPVLRYFREYLFNSIWAPGAEFVDILRQLTVQYRVEGNPLNQKTEAKNVKK